MQREEKFMREAIKLSRSGMENNEGGPFGCVIVKGDEIVGRGWNKVLVNNDPTAHAEITAIREACEHLGTFQLEGCEIYTSCEPCPMCMGAIYWARPDKVFYANTRADAARIGFDDSMIYEELTLPLHQRKIEIHCLGQEEAIKVFEEWITKGDKNLY
jgi:guanine deaminase